MHEKEKMMFVALLIVLKNSKQSKCLTIGNLLNGITVRWGTIQLFKVVMIYICYYVSFIDVYSLYVLNCVIVSGNK